MWFWNRKEVYLGWSLEEFSKIKSRLVDNHIKYDYKIQDNSSTGLNDNGFFTTANHHEVIDKYAKEGWKLVQVLPMYYNGQGKPTQYEIIFERMI